MEPKQCTTLSIAVGSGKIGCVFTIDGEVMDWELSKAASKNENSAAAKATEWMQMYSPDLVITERLTLHNRKRGQAIRNIEVIEQVIQKLDVHHVDVERIQRYANKYAEIDALVKRHPVIANWAPPKRRIWESEPANTVLFEALSLIAPNPRKAF